jgi:hypothetical protein
VYGRGIGVQFEVEFSQGFIGGHGGVSENHRLLFQDWRAWLVESCACWHWHSRGSNWWHFKRLWQCLEEVVMTDNMSEIGKGHILLPSIGLCMGGTEYIRSSNFTKMDWWVKKQIFVGTSFYCIWSWNGRVN